MTAPPQSTIRVPARLRPSRQAVGIHCALFWAFSCALFLAGRTVCVAQPHQQQDNLQQAEALLQQGHRVEALDAIQSELQRNPSSVEAWNLLGILKTGEQDFSAAAAAFQKALQLAPRSVRTHNNLGNLYVDQKRPDLAEKEFRTALRLDPANRDAHYNLGVVLLSNHSPMEAATQFNLVRPQDLTTRFNLVRALLQSKRTTDALQLARSLSAENSGKVQVHFTLVMLLASEGQFIAAQTELEKADALAPSTFEILFNLGQVQLRINDAAKADLVLGRALQLRPDSPETLYLKAKALTLLSHPLDALDLLIKARRIAPENADVLFLMAQISMAQNYFEDAIPLLESGLRVAPQRTDMIASLGECYFMAGKIDKAIEQFTKLADIEHTARAYAFLGLAYRHLGRFDDAKKYFQLGLQIDPRNPSCLYNLGFIAERQGDSAQAESFFQRALRIDPDFPDDLLELANLRISAKRYAEAEGFLRKFVQFSHNPATGYYKLAMVERSLHQTAEADRALRVFKSLSSNANSGPFPYEHLFDYLDQRSVLAPEARSQLDLQELREEVRKHPDQPQDLYLLAEACLRAHANEEAQSAVEQLDKLNAGDFRTLASTGVLLARYHLYDAAVRHFQAALQASPDSDEVKFDLANATFRMRLYAQALDIANTISPAGRSDDSFQQLLGDIYMHMDDSVHATEIFKASIRRNPDNDQTYLSLALLQLHSGKVAEAQQTLRAGQSRIPASGKLYWGLGLASALQGSNAPAARQFERAVELLPEWPGGYSTLGVFYFQTGQVEKAQEVLNRFRASSVGGTLDTDRIAQTLRSAASALPATSQPMNEASREQFLQMALTLADRTL
jgi:tetratricopeptide (TPR) repeat protein